MKRTSYLGLALVVVLASWAIASASAYAAVEWKVAGTALKSLKPPEEKLTEEVKVVKGFTLKKKNGLTITCTKLKATNGFIEGTVGNRAEALSFSGCTVTSNAKCEVSQPIKTAAVKSTLEAGPPVKIKFVPKTGTEFVTITLKSKKSETCAQAGKFKVTGSATGEAPSATTEKTGHLLNFTEKSGSKLTFGEETSIFTGESELTLASGKKYSG
jgi:hypothetical protein